MGESVERWQAVDPACRTDACRHSTRYRAADVLVICCLLCGSEVEPVRAQVIELDAARRRLAGRSRR